MKKIMAYMLSTVLSIGILFSTIEIDAFAASGNDIVYVTQTGECYHADGCSSLRKSKIAKSLQEATDLGYRACSKCNPGTMDVAPAPKTPNSPKNPATPESKEVWLSASGSCYHKINNCGNMNPNKARKVTEEEAKKKGKKACSKCW